MLRSNLIGTLLAVAAFGPGTARASSENWEPVEAPSVTLLDAGEAPRRALRYGIQPGSWSISRKHRYEAAVKLPIRGKQGDEGTVALDFAAWPLQPTGDAPIEIGVELTEAIRRGGPAEALPGASGRIRYSDRGLPVATQWDLHPAEADAENVSNRMLLDRFRTRATHLATPLPEEPVGAGARWEIRQTLTQGASAFTMIAVCTLNEDRGEGLDILCRYSHDPEATKVALGSERKQRKVEILESSVTGQSLILQRLDVIAPIREDGSILTYFKAKTRISIAPVKVDVTSDESWSQVLRGAD